ncbi:MAG: LamG-like jellyroll fold domain-containing protein [Candidatus Paceibacterota bacterium]
MKPNSFTLIELVIVIAILAILAAVVVITLNPGEYMKSARDSTRMSDLQTIHSAIGLYQADGGTSIGSINTVYVSIPDSSATCANLGLPILPTGWSYACSNTTNYRKTDGTGWIPVHFSDISFTNPLSSLPADPINTTSTGNYYTYVTGGSWELTTIFESSKYATNAATDGGADFAQYEIGSNLTLSPFTHGLVGYWKFDEASGTLYDSSGHGNNGTQSGGVTYEAQGKVGNALSFDGNNDYVDCGNANSLKNITNKITIAYWVYINSYPAGNYTSVVEKGYAPIAGRSWMSGMTSTGSGYFFIRKGDDSTYSYPDDLGWTIIPLGTWMHMVHIFDGSRTYGATYRNGNLDHERTNLGFSNIYISNYNVTVGKDSYYFNGKIDDVRIYNRALSAVEIQAIYNATK